MAKKTSRPEYAHDTIVDIRSAGSALFEKFAHADHITGRDVDAYVDTIADHLARAGTSEKELEILFSDAVAPPKSLDAPAMSEYDQEVKKKTGDLTHAVIRDFSHDELDTLLDQVEKREVAEKMGGEIEEEEVDGYESRKRAEENYAQAQQAFSELRSLIIERLKIKIDNDERLGAWKKKGIKFFERFPVGDRPHIQIVRDMEGKVEILRKDRVLSQSENRKERIVSYNEEEKKNYIQAVEVLKRLPPSKYLVGLSAFDPESKSSFFEFKNFTSLNTLVKNAREPLSAQVGYIRDALRGALEAARSGIGIQDISLLNVSVVTDPKTGEKHGALTDLEGVYLLGASLHSRMLLDSVSSKEEVDQLGKTGESAVSPYRPPELDDTIVFRESEMVYQFGVTLEMLGITLDLKNKLDRSLFQSWKQTVKEFKAYDPEAKNRLEKRPSLVRAEKKMNDLIVLLHEKGV